MKSSLLFIPVLFVLLLPCAKAQSVTQTTTIQVQVTATHAKGSHLRAEVEGLVELMRAKKLAEADRGAIELQKKFEALFNPAMRQYSFQSEDEQREFKKSSSKAFEWIDWGYRECLQMRAFIAAERRDFPATLALLNAIEAVAPVSAGTSAERGYVLNQLGKPQEGLAAYQRALAVAKRYPSQRPYQAAALRGIGFALIELKRLDEAERHLRDSLKLEPGNEVALNELSYIQDLRADRRVLPSPTSHR